MTQIRSFHVPEGGNSLGLHTGYSRVAVEEARNSVFAKYRDAGISAIPIKVDGSKKPLVLWERFKHYLPTDQDFVDWTASNRTENMGVGCLTGCVSRGMEALDFDQIGLFERFSELVSATLLARLPTIATPSGGRHLIYRCQEICRSRKIAMTKNGKVRIESRGEGAYIVAVGSPPETHPAMLPYVQISGPKFPIVPSITIEERNAIWLAARSFDERQFVESAVQKQLKTAERHGRHCASHARGTSRLCDNMSWGDILRPMGWTSNDDMIWLRPGKTSPGLSAKVNAALDGTEILTVFSSNAGVLAPTEGHKSWNKFAAFAALYHKCDWKVATAELKKIKVR